MSNKIILFFLASSLFFSGCMLDPQFNIKIFKEQAPQEQLISTKDISDIWQLSEVTLDIIDSNNDLLAEANNNLILETGFRLCLFPDGEASEFKDEEYLSYKWELNPVKKTIALKSDSHADTLHITDYKNISNQEYLSLQINNIGICSFTRMDSMLADFKHDPFYPANNLWRIKPEKEENKKELNERLLNYVQHTLYVLKAALERKSNVVSFENSQGIIKIYNGGIGIKKEKNIPEMWKSGFYNEEQAMMAYELFRLSLDKTKYKGATSGNWVKDDYKILLTLYRTISKEVNN